MNIFFLDRSPSRAAVAHRDKHVTKMILETAQLLSAAHHKLNPSGVAIKHEIVGFQRVPRYYLIGALSDSRIYAPTHLSHPVALWVCENVANYRWTHDLGLALLNEYQYRYGREHATGAVITALDAAPPECVLPLANDISEPAQCMPEQYRVLGDAVLAYRQYYKAEKSKGAKYTKRNPPEWLNTEVPLTAQ